MSEEEIRQAQKFLLEQLGKNHQGALKKFQTNFGKTETKPVVDESIKEETKEMPQLDTGTVSAQVQQQAMEMEKNTRLARTLAINVKGDLIIDEEDDTSDEEDEARYLSYITADDFETLDQKFFKLTEIANLLASSDLRQRMFALNILIKLVSRKLSDQDATYVFGIVLHPDYVQPCSIVARID